MNLLLRGSRPSCWILLLLLVCGCSKPAPGKLLRYAFTPPAAPAPGAAYDDKMWLKIFERRMNIDGNLAKVSWFSSDAKVLRVQLVSADPQREKQARWRLARKGTLQFRVLADRMHHAELIAAALAAPLASHEVEVQTPNGEVRGRWVPLALSAEGKPWLSLDAERFAVRQRDGRSEVLVVLDKHNFSEQNLVKLMFGNEENGQPALRYYLDARAAYAMGQFTESLLPKSPGAVPYEMGTLLDGELRTTAPITQMQQDQGLITGEFTYAEIQDWMAVLQPVEVRKLEYAHGALETPLELLDTEGN